MRMELFTIKQAFGYFAVTDNRDKQISTEIMSKRVRRDKKVLPLILEKST